MHVVFFDTETTGKDEKDRLCQLAFEKVVINGDDFAGEVMWQNNLYKPPLDISIEAMSVHHITQEMVADKPTFAESSDFEDIRSLFQSPDTYVVAHNAKFDIEMLAREGVKPMNVICTLKLARHFDPDGKIPKYNLQYLRYLLGLNVEATAHDALGDVYVLRALFDRLYKKVVEGYQIPFPMPQDYLAEMVRISSAPVKIVRFQFGKHVGKKIEEVAQTDRDYLGWLFRSEREKPMPDADLLYSLQPYV